MPYLQVDLDGKRKWPLIAAGLGVHEGFVAKGFLDLWEMCWREKTDTVSQLHLELLFSAKGERVAEVLAEMGFAERLDDGRVRVRGAQKYLRISESRSEGAKKTNAKRWGSGVAQSSLERQGSVAQASLERRSTVALTPITQHQSPSTEHQDLFGAEAPPAATPPKKPRMEKPPADPRYAPLVKALCTAFTELRGGATYGFEAKDGAAVKRLLTKGNDAEILSRWRRSLGLGSKWPGTSSLVAFADRWNDLAGSTGPPRDLTRGRVGAEDVNWDGVKTEVGHGF